MKTRSFDQMPDPPLQDYGNLSTNTPPAVLQSEDVGNSSPKSPELAPRPLTATEALDWIRGQSDPNEALLLLAQFWGMLPQGNALEPHAFNLYRELRGRLTESTSESTQGWKTSNLPLRIAQLGGSYMILYQRQWTIEAVHRSIECFEEAIALFAEGDGHRPGILSNYANTLMWRFERQSDPSDLDNSIRIQRLAIESTPAGESYLPTRLRSLGIALGHRYDRFGLFSDLEEGISTIEKAIEVEPDNHPDHAEHICDLGTLLRDRYHRKGQFEDLESAILNHQLAVSLTPDSNPLRNRFLDDLGLSFSTRFDYSGDVSDLSQAVSCFDQSVQATSDDHIDKPTRIHHLGSAFHHRFQRLGTISDLHEGISLLKRAVDLTPSAGARRAIMLTALAGALFNRFESLEDMDDLDQALDHQNHALSLYGANDPNRPSTLDTLGVFLVARFQSTGELSSLEQGIAAQEQAVSFFEDSDKKATSLSNLGSSMMRRFERLNNFSDVEKAVTMHREAVALTPNGHKKMARRLNHLAVALSRKSRISDRLLELDEAVSLSEQAVALAPGDHPDRSIWLHNLGSMLAHRFDHTGKLNDLDDAISHQTRSIELVENAGRIEPMWLHNLGKSLLSRFDVLGNQADIDRSVSTHGAAVSHLSNEHSNMPLALNGLGITLRARFVHYKQHTDLSQAISVLQQATRLTPDGHPDRPRRLSALGTALITQYRALGDISDLEEAISVQRLAVEGADNSDSIRAFWMNHLGMSLAARFDRLGNRPDIDESIDHHSRAVSLMPDTHPEKAALWHNLGLALDKKLHQNTDDRTAQEQLLNAFYSSYSITSGAPRIRMISAYRLAMWTSKLQHPNVLNVYKLALDLVPSFIWLGKTVSQRYQDAVITNDLVTNAATEAIIQGQYDIALGWLEQGRTVIWDQILKLRTPVDDIRQVDTSLADRLQDVSVALQRASNPNSDLHLLDEEATRTQHRLAEEWDNLVERVRAIPSFQGFLRPPNALALASAAHSSTVVIINISQRRCDAIVLLPQASSGFTVQLPSFSLKKAQEMRQILAKSLLATGVRERGFKKGPPSTAASHVHLRDVLLSLWVDIVQPILERLGYLELHTESHDLPRITWCATGPLSLLPLHAAGDYSSTGPENKVFSYVVSSYTPTISSILVKPPTPDSFKGILAIGQSTTTGMSALPGTTEELDHIEKLSSSLRFKRLEGPQATYASVLDGMHDHSWVHFACHASQSIDTPTESAFFLYDKPLDLAAISRAPFQAAGLAFLSACQTAAGIENLSEEVVHLAAGMLMSGYPSVVATMWSVRDQDAPIVTERVYARLLEGGVASTVNASRALHEAIAHLRKRVGEDNFEAWVPYIHVGL